MEDWNEPKQEPVRADQKSRKRNETDHELQGVGVLGFDVDGGLLLATRQDAADVAEDVAAVQEGVVRLAETDVPAAHGHGQQGRAHRQRLHQVGDGLQQRVERVEQRGQALAGQRHVRRRVLADQVVLLGGGVVDRVGRVAGRRRCVVGRAGRVVGRSGRVVGAAVGRGGGAGAGGGGAAAAARGALDGRCQRRHKPPENIVDAVRLRHDA